MKEQDVRIGMKVRIKGTEDACIILNEKDYRTMYGNVYSLRSINTGIKKTLNACDFEPYIDITDVEYQNIADAINTFSEVLGKELNKAVETLQEWAEKNRDAIEEFAKKTEKEEQETRGDFHDFDYEPSTIETMTKKTEKERQNEEIEKSFGEHVKKYGNDFSLFSCYKAGYIAGREGK